MGKTFKLLVTGGGTAGHITPGIAVVDEIRRRNIPAEFLWVGARGRKEEDLAPRAGINLETLNIYGIQRALSPNALINNFRGLFYWLSGIPFFKAYSILKRFKPDFVLGTGGYVCAPVLIAARFLKIRSWILEQNSAPGMAVRLLAPWTEGVGIAYESSRAMLSGARRIEMFGNPVPPSVMIAEREEGMQFYDLNPDMKTLLVIGGSLGSETLNKAIAELLKKMLSCDDLKGWQILHSAGQAKYAAFSKTVALHPIHHLHPFLYRPDLALAAADVALCRGGAMTLAEITARGTPSIIVPWPGAVRNHQWHNANSLAEQGAAIAITESDFSGDALFAQLKSLAETPSKLESLSQNARRMGKPDAAEKVADLILGSEK